MKRSIVSAIAILLFFNQYLHAQDRYEDVVYLKNGSVFRGMIFEQVPGKSVTIESADQLVFTFTYEEIEKIRKELRQSGTFSSSDDGTLSANYTNVFQFGMLTTRSGVAPTTLSVIRSGDVGEHSSLGLGVGWNTYGNRTMVPLFVDARSFLFKGQASPFVFTDVGYSYGKVKGVYTWNAGGFVLNAGAGFVVHSSTALSFVMQASYHLQQAKVFEPGHTFDYGMFGLQYVQPPYEYRVNYEFVMITFGIGF